MSLLQTIRNKPEATRRSVAVVIYILLGFFILTAWIWHTSGTFPYESVTNTVTLTKTKIEAGGSGFQDFRNKLGEEKEKFLKLFSTTPEITEYNSTATEDIELKNINETN